MRYEIKYAKSSKIRNPVLLKTLTHPMDSDCLIDHALYSSLP